jgi:hypothetical protein
VSPRDRRMLAIGPPAALIAATAAGALSQRIGGSYGWVAGPLAIGLAAGGTIGVLGLVLRCPRIRLLLALGLLAALAGNAASWWQAVRDASTREFVWQESESDYSRRQTEDTILNGVLNQRPPVERKADTASPKGLSEYLRWRLRHGWPERGQAYSGLAVALLYVGELIFTLYVAIRMLSTLVFSKPFCMKHGQWATRELTLLVGDADRKALEAAAEAEDSDTLLSLPKSPGSKCAATYAFQRCPQCESTLLSISVRKGRREEYVLDDLPVTREQMLACAQRVVP